MSCRFAAILGAQSDATLPFKTRRAARRPKISLANEASM
jgi:hypothetical protein